MANPFEDEDGSYLVLVNSEQQYSLWPAQHPVPDGWSTAHGADTRAACLAYVEEVWTDMRPTAVRNAAQQPAG